MRQERLRRSISVGMLVLLILIFSMTAENFLNSKNLLSILRESSLVGMISVGVTYVIITAGIDLSTGAVMGVSGMLCANLIYYYQIPAWLVIVIALLCGILCGFLNGILVTTLRLPDFIATLSTQFIFGGMMLVFSIKESGAIVTKVIDTPGILALGKQIGGIYYVSLAFLVFACLGQFVLKRTRFGTYIYATGANRKAAELSGIPTNRIKLIVFTITGFLSGIAALFSMGRIGSVSTTFGDGMAFDVISAVVIGGCAFSGGRGDVVGSVIGALFMAVLDNGILKYNFPTAIQLIVKGSVIVVMVLFDAMYQQYMESLLRRKNNLEDGTEVQRNGI